MADIKSASARSANMSAIKSKNTEPEVLIRKALFALRYRYRLHLSNLPGKPDITLKKYNAVIFVHGCSKYRLPQTRQDFWKEKITKNISRDKLAVNKLLESEWRVLIIWECSIRGKYKLGLNETVSEIDSCLKSKNRFYEIKDKKHV